MEKEVNNGTVSFLDCKDGSQILNNTMADVYVLIPAAFGGGHIHESFYDGYGNFGGFDIYDLLVDWNDPESDLDGDEKRNHGIDLFFGDTALEYPVKITHDANAVYENCEPSPDDPNQGWYVKPYDPNKRMPEVGDAITIGDDRFYVVGKEEHGDIEDTLYRYRPYDISDDNDHLVYVYGEEGRIWAYDFNRDDPLLCECYGPFDKDFEIRICGNDNPNCEI